MPDVFSNYAANRGMLAMLGRSQYLALHETDPTLTGDPATETAGGGYLRVLIRLSNPSARAQANTSSVRFSGMPGRTIPYMAYWDSISGGNMNARILLPTPLVVSESGQVIVEVGDIAITM